MKSRKRAPRAIRQLGYIGAIVAFVVMWWAVGHLSEWDWPSFLTGDIDDVVPWFRASLAVDIAFTAAYVGFDPLWFKAIGDAIRAAVNGVVAFILLKEFPFDFSSYSFDWEQVARIALIVGIVGAWITAIVHLVRAILLLAKPANETASNEGTATEPKDSPV